MTESTKKQDGHDRSTRLDQTGERGILREGEMGAGVVVVVGIAPNVFSGGDSFSGFHLW
jgi:hypothetical protein